MAETGGLMLSKRAVEPSPAQVHGDLKAAREELTRLLDAHVEPARACLGATTGEFYLADLLLAGVLLRSFHLLEGFCAALDSWNVIVAAPLVRLQIDNLLRLNYFSLGPDLDDITIRLLKGEELRKFKDSDDRQLTDLRLRELAAARYPWVDEVYEKSSGWVHFSGAHIYSVCQAGADEGTLESFFPLRPRSIPRSLLQELLEVMSQATSDLLEYFASWEEHKAELAAARETSAE